MKSLCMRKGKDMEIVKRSVVAGVMGRAEMINRQRGFVGQ